MQYILVSSLFLHQLKRPELTPKNDVLGQVDNLHLALSDFESPFDSDPLQLSTIHSVSQLPAYIESASWHTALRS